MLSSLNDFGLIRWLKWILKKYSTLITIDSKNVRIGYFSYVKDSKLGNYVRVKDYVMVDNSSIGDFSYVSFRSAISNCTIGKFCSVGQDVKCGLPHHPVHFVSTHPIFYSKLKQVGITFAEEQFFEEKQSTYIGNDVWIGSGAMIVGGVTIGDGAIIGAGALVLKDVDPYSIVGGVPAKHIKYRFSSEIIDHLLDIKWWNRNISELKANYRDYQDIESFIKRQKRRL